MRCPSGSRPFLLHQVEVTNIEHRYLNRFATHHFVFLVSYKVGNDYCDHQGHTHKSPARMAQQERYRQIDTDRYPKFKTTFPNL